LFTQVSGTHDMMTVSVTGNAVTVTGEVDTSNCDQLDDAIAALNSTRPARVNLSNVTFMDSSGLRVLLRHHQLRTAGGSQLELVAPSTQVRRVVEVLGLLDVFRIVEE
jgi:anti-sigma B factor antagonist